MTRSPFMNYKFANVRLQFLGYFSLFADLILVKLDSVYFVPHHFNLQSAKYTDNNDSTS